MKRFKSLLLQEGWLVANLWPRSSIKMLRQFSARKSQRIDQRKIHRLQRKEARQITMKNLQYESNSFSSRSSSQFSRPWFHQILMLIRSRSLTWWCEASKVPPQQWSHLSWSHQRASNKTQTTMTWISSSALSPSATPCRHFMRT